MILCSYSHSLEHFMLRLDPFAAITAAAHMANHSSFVALFYGERGL